MTKQPEKLLAEIQEYYQVGPNFAKAYLDYWQRGFDYPFENLNEIRRLPPPQSVWFRFAMMTNLRGLQIAKQVTPHIPKNAQRYLDVGCGHGGSLVAFSKLGLDVLGIDINDQLIELSNSNCSDHGLKNCTLKGDFLDGGFVESLGKFDVITVLAVIEHVADAVKTLKNAAGLLNPGGIMVLDIPNKDSLSFVARDPHYSLFGLTLLERHLAIQYYKSFFSEEYDVGEFYELDFYIQQLKRFRCESTLIKTPETAAHLGRDLALPFWLLYRYLLYQAKTKKHLPAPIQKQVQTNFSQYLTGMFKYREASRTVDKQGTFRIKYLTNVWTLVAQKRI
jgi:2-polyprenyl-3-methyl-5-hydroxy-6-metoxy-1,4-benzoquinol methylase